MAARPGPPRRRLAARAVGYLAVTTLAAAALFAPGRAEMTDLDRLLRGPDDAMRLVQVTDWLDGQPWRDLVQRRLDPPAGVEMHWSRLADLPVGGAVLLAEPFVGRSEALRLAAAAVPPLLGGLCVALFFWAARPLTMGRGTMVILLVVPALVVPLTQFRPGRVDHHGLQLVLAVLGIGLLLRAVGTGDSRPAAALGVLAACSLAVGLEGVPFAAAAAVALGLAWTFGRRPAAVPLAFGTAVTATAAVLVIAMYPASAWLNAACDRLSVAQVAACAAALAVGGAAFGLERVPGTTAWPARLAAAAGVAAAALAAVAAAFPQCASGPYGEVDPAVRYWLDNVREAEPLTAMFGRKPGLAAGFAALPLAALALGVVYVGRSRQAPGPDHAVALLLLAISGIAVLAWQIRGSAYAGLVAAVTLVPLAAAINARVDRVRRLLPRIGLRLCTPAVCVAATLVPVGLGLDRNAAAGPDAVSGSDPPVCDLRAALPLLVDPAGLGGASRLLAAPIDLGPDLLLLTPHSVLAAPYHRASAGLADNRRLFAGSEPAARAVVARRGVDAVLFCHRYTHVTAFPGSKGFLNSRLAAGEPPDWLEPLLETRGLGLYRVLDSAEQPQRRSSAKHLPQGDPRRLQGDGDTDSLDPGLLH